MRKLAFQPDTVKSCYKEYNKRFFIIIMPDSQLRAVLLKIHKLSKLSIFYIAHLVR